MRVVLRAVFLSAVVVACGVALFAGEPGNTPPPHAKDDGISAAKRDYETIQSLRVSTEQQKLDLPKTQVPELQTRDEPTPGVIGPPELQRDALKKKNASKLKGGPKSGNWLLDAMKEKKDGDKADADGDLDPESIWGDGKLDEKERGGKTSANSRGKPADAKDDDRPKSAPLPNPMDRYLSDWITPRDYALLKQADKSAAESSKADASAPVADVGSANSPAITLPTDLFGPDNAGKGAGPVLVAPRDNPYIEKLNVPSPGSNLAGPSQYLPPAKASSEAPAAPAFTPPAPEAKPPSAIDRLKARDDSKYFPQLKRF